MTIDHNSKSALRRSILEQRGRLTEQARQAKSEAICEAILTELGKQPNLIKSGQALFTFMPFGHETDIMPVVEWCWSRGIPTIAPRTTKEPREMYLHRVHSKQQLQPGMWGIPEPLPSAPEASPDDIGVILVPGVAFDHTGSRLGYGGGYYDRFFAQLRERGLAPLKLAPAFDLQLIRHVPMEEHDERMDLIVTETARIVPAPAPTSLTGGTDDGT